MPYNGLVTVDKQQDQLKTLGRRRRSRGGLAAAAPLRDLVIDLRRGKPFIPEGLHRFLTFEESPAWSLQMMSRPTPDRRG
jgi:hypothetical protein